MAAVDSVADGETPAVVATSTEKSYGKGAARLRKFAKTKLAMAAPKPIPDTDDLGILWDHFNDKGKPDFFGSIKIDHQAGFDELEELWHPRRYIFGAVSLLTLVANTLTIVYFNGQLLYTYLVVGEKTTVFLVSDYFIKQILGDTGFPPIAVIAILELALAVIMYVWGIKNFLFMFNPLQSEVMRWHAVANFFFRVFPTLSTLSLVKLLGYVTPQVLTPSLVWTIHRMKYLTGSCELGYFIGSRLLCFFLGFDAFLYKFQIIGLLFIEAQQTNYESVDRDLIFTTLLFVNQMLGIVQLGVFTKQRLFVFIFAGEDGRMSEEEDAIKQTFEAMLCWELTKAHGIFKAIFIVWSFSDADFQRLVLDTKKGKAQTGTGAAANAGLIARFIDG